MNLTKPRIGLIGAGMIAQSHARYLLESKRCSVDAVAAASTATVDKVSKMFSIPEGTTDYKVLLKNPDIDVVIISTPPYLHKKMFIDALKAGKHILLEKPLAPTSADCESIVAARKMYPKLMVLEASCRHARLQPKYAMVKKIIDSGALGDIYHIHHNAVGRQGRPGIEYHPAAKWFLNKKLAGGGPMVDWGAYDLSFHLGVLGDRHTLKSLKSFAKGHLDTVNPGTKTYDVEEHGAAYIEFDKGLTYYWERGSNAHNETPNETRIYGTQGGIKLAYCSWDTPEVTFFDVERGGKGKARKKVMPVNMKGHGDDNKMLMLHFLDCLAGKAKPAMTVELAARNMEIALAVANSKSR